jgi:hypothetical protein
LSLDLLGSGNRLRLAAEINMIFPNPDSRGTEVQGLPRQLFSNYDLAIFPFTFYNLKLVVLEISCCFPGTF